MKLSLLILSFVVCFVFTHSLLPIQVTTDKGPIKGFSNNGLNYFLGVPYAQPPLGSLRWKPPQPHQPWTDVLATDQFSSACIQNPPSGYTFPSNVTYSEDCLYLNIWAPDTATTGKAVMFWIHGGGLTNGGNSEFRLRGEHFCMMGDVILVNINYRLGTLGWLAHPAFATEDPMFPSSGNYGYLDQVRALQWVQDNIHLFGGDPKKVTIMGESAGGSSVCFHMVVKKSFGLFSQAIPESNACFGETTTLEKAQNFAKSVESSLNCKGDNQQVIQCMRAATTKQILDVKGSLTSAVVDGFVFVEHPYKTISSGKAVLVPLLSGNVRDEGSGFVGVPRPVNKANYQTYVKNYWPDYTSQVLQEYPCDAYNASDCWYALYAAFGDCNLICPNQKLATTLAPSVTTYTYEFAHPPLWGKSDFAFHSSEIAFVFSTLMDIYPYTPEEVTLAHQLTYFWTSFGKTGNPNSENVNFKWSIFSPPTYPVAVLDLTLNTTNGYKIDNCNFWDGYYKLVYSY